jgi:ABC-type antimicrobial peptide transport system permease subunit
MVLRQGTILTGAGLVLGLVLTLALAGAVGSGVQQVLFGVSPFDPLTYAAVIALVAVISFAASIIPARRATRVDPMIALRAE